MFKRMLIHTTYEKPSKNVFLSYFTSFYRVGDSFLLANP